MDDITDVVTELASKTSDALKDVSTSDVMDKLEASRKLPYLGHSGFTKKDIENTVRQVLREHIGSGIHSVKHGGDLLDVLNAIQGGLEELGKPFETSCRSESRKNRF